MKYESSHKIEAALRGWPALEAVDAADAYVVEGEDKEMDCFESGFNLAMKVVQAGALSKYAGREPLVFGARADGDKPVRLFFVGVDEDEIVARLRA